MDRTNLFIDIHTHKIQTDSQIAVLNLIINKEFTGLPQFTQQNKDNQKIYFSAGIHPWYMKEWQMQIERLKEIASKPNIIAIGECGLDKKAEKPIAEQIELFHLQIALSEHLQKPLIIHCVKAFNELIEIKKNTKAKMPWIVHGFNGSIEIAMHCINSGMTLSFGKSLLNANSNNIQIIKTLSNSSFFLETDDSIFSIEEVYSKCSAIKNITIEQLTSDMAKNFNNIFKC